MSMKKSLICFSAAGFLALQALLPAAANASSEVKSEKMSVADPYPGHVIKYGDRGSDVRKVQTQLNKNRIPITVDGIFGNVTLKKVKQFQYYRYLKADGLVGPSTWHALYHTPVPYPGHVIKLGDRGQDVTRIQARLNDAGGSIKIDGIFGPKTEVRVKGFQKKHHLRVDGIVGRETWEVLFNYEE
ncbi:peptidoglycan-binding protein [Fictibacillus enclensis]|uniref:peptidoglycan-binding domain-containing protein n=1 Tax=Fictibacillus enclensis TaxID=1017270 RepID=UPI0024BF22FD|nr:peptidoglycan-binding protein [Fictibacillus enclensis]MDM5196626.1 peptidoglycan-binding protein [Fictibacillus enclensis]WHY71208.1 peptidoglycan-binding protein [Fictibacillus enclensis]